MTTTTLPPLPPVPSPVLPQVPPAAPAATKSGGLALLASVAGLVAVPAALIQWDACPRTVWLSTLAASGLFLYSISAITKTPLLTDERGRWSLSRLQILLWTWLLLSTFGAIVAIRIHAGLPDPVAVELDQNLWLLLGINATSFVGSSVLVARKETAKPGVLHVRAMTTNHTDVGRVSDLFLGEDAATAGVIDIGRVQMFFFTIVAIVVYGAAIAKAMGAEPKTLVFPGISESFVALLAISHTAYLANKLPDRTRPT